MTQLFLEKDQVIKKFPLQSWQRILFAEMESCLSNQKRPFPCIYGIAGFITNNLRFSFLDSITPDTLAPILENYLPNARKHGRNASLVVFEKPGSVQSMESYRQKFWSLLDGLAQKDKSPWPANIPHSLDDPHWEFSFAGEPIFVVCSTPAHVQRQSRRSSGFMLTMQPRWVFDGITSTEDLANAAFGAVRRRLANFDIVDPSPALGRYGEAQVREYAQYFIDDDNGSTGCPMARLSASTRQTTLEAKYGS